MVEGGLRHRRGNTRPSDTRHDSRDQQDLLAPPPWTQPRPSCGAPSVLHGSGQPTDCEAALHRRWQ
eukprot:8943450-Alexandrium_andersonii.AAC.1